MAKPILLVKITKSMLDESRARFIRDVSSIVDDYHLFFLSEDMEAAFELTVYNGNDYTDKDIEHLKNKLGCIIQS